MKRKPRLSIDRLHARIAAARCARDAGLVTWRDVLQAWNSTIPQRRRWWRG